MILNSFILKQSLDMYPSKNNVMNVMDVMTGCFECFCSFNKKSILCLFLLTC
jgi:hypothetical protein